MKVKVKFPNCTVTQRRFHLEIYTDRTYLVYGEVEITPDEMTETEEKQWEEFKNCPANMLEGIPE